MPCSRLPVVGGLATTLALTALCVLPGTISAQTHEFADWTSVDSGTATGALRGSSITLSGSAVINVPGSTVDGSSTVFSSSLFAPPLPTSDAIEFNGYQGNSYTLQFGAPVTDPILHLYSLASTLAFPDGTELTKLSGEDSFTVSGSSVSGALSGSSDASGSVRVSGTFSSIPFSATPVYQPSTEDGILLQVGVALPPAPALTARYTVAPNPTCVGVPTVFDAGSSSPGTGGAITNYRFDYYETDAFGLPALVPTVLASSASPTATIRFPWSHQSGAASWSRGTPSVWVRDPAAVTLTVTDAAGAAATTATTVEFAQATSVSPREGCPPDDGAPRPRTAPPRFEEDPTVSARDILVAAACLVDPAGCTGDVVAALPSLALEAQRQALISEAKRLDQEIDQGNTDARERLRALKDELPRLLDRIRETRDTERSAFPSRRRHPEVVAQAPYRLAPGDHAVVRARLSKRARRVLNRYGRLRVTVSMLALTPRGTRKVRARVVTLKAPRKIR